MKYFIVTKLCVYKEVILVELDLVLTNFEKKCSDGPKFYMCCTKRKNLLVNKMLDHASMTLFNIDET